MKHTVDWVHKYCTPFVTYAYDFQIWKHKTKDEYWAYNGDEEGFIQVKLIANERHLNEQDEFELMGKYDNDWCGEVDDSYDVVSDTYEYAWFERI